MSLNCYKENKESDAFGHEVITVSRSLCLMCSLFFGIVRSPIFVDPFPVVSLTGCKYGTVYSNGRSVTFRYTSIVSCQLIS